MSKLVYSKRFLEHNTGAGHPEGMERLAAIIEFLKEKGIEEFEAPLEIGENELLCVHSKKLIEEIKQLSEQQLSVGDNAFNENTFEIALLAAGSALKAARLCKKEFAFSLARPPGHHAGKDFFGGFCYFNSIAFAIRKIMQERELQKAMIIDFDMHHGNGTQNIFADDSKVFYLSLHQDPENTFPGTGKTEENNFHIRNVLLKQGTNEKDYVKIFEENFLECLDDFRPEILGVSAGFDILSSNMGVGNRLSIKNTQIFGRLSGIIKTAQKPTFAVLEGGYAVSTLGESVFGFLNSFE